MESSSQWLSCQRLLRRQSKIGSVPLATSRNPSFWDYSKDSLGAASLQQRSQ